LNFGSKLRIKRSEELCTGLNRPTSPVRKTKEPEKGREEAWAHRVQWTRKHHGAKVFRNMHACRYEVAEPQHRSLLKLNFHIKFMERPLRLIAEDVWASGSGPGYSESVYRCAFEVGAPYRRCSLRDGTYRPRVLRRSEMSDTFEPTSSSIAGSVVELWKSVSRLNETYRIQTQLPGPLGSLGA
jgi:hypothetical protein